MDADNTVLIALIAMIGTIVTSAISAYVLVRTGRIEKRGLETFDLVNGVSHELTAAKVGQARAEGELEGASSSPAVTQAVEATATNTERIAQNTERLG